MKIPSNHVPDFVEFLATSGLARKFLGDSKQLMLTGGGAHKYARLIEERLGITVVKTEEMQMLVDGVNFFIRNNVYEEFFTWNSETKQKEFLSNVDDSFFPFILVNIGSGVSILRIDGYGQFERVSGTSVGGGTFWGLTRLLTKVKTFAEVEQLCNIGNNANVDLMVSDIYGPNGFEALGLGGDVIASSFGKIGSVRHVHNPAEPSEYEPADIIRSLLFMVTNNVTQISFLNAQRHGCKRIVFAGGFIQRNPYVWGKLNYGVNFWSKGSVQSHMLQHDGYLGALGSFLCESRVIQSRKSSLPPAME